MNIPGLQKGVGGQAAAPQRALRLFKPGDNVVHSVFGRGTVERIEGEGAEQKVIVRFANGNAKRFSASIAPLRRIDG